MIEAQVERLLILIVLHCHLIFRSRVIARSGYFFTPILDKSLSVPRLWDGQLKGKSPNVHSRISLSLSVSLFIRDCALSSRIRHQRAIFCCKDSLGILDGGPEVGDGGIASASRKPPGSRGSWLKQGRAGYLSPRNVCTHNII